MQHLRIGPSQLLSDRVKKIIQVLMDFYLLQALIWWCHQLQRYGRHQMRALIQKSRQVRRRQHKQVPQMN